MKQIPFVTTFTLLVFFTGICQADSLVITYRSGKIQTVVLDEPSLTINSWQFVGGTTPQQQSKKSDEAPVPTQQEQIQKGMAIPPQTASKPTEKTTEKKSGIRVKWNAKPIPE